MTAPVTQSPRPGSAAGTERLRLRDVWSLPGVLSLVRVPLAVAFPFVLPRPALALAVLAAAAASDVLDGWCARRSGRTTMTGAVLDPVMDKLFVATVAVTLLVSGRLSLVMVLLLGARDVLELPLAAWMMIRPGDLADRSGRVKANMAGKIATVTQFATVAAAIFGWAHALLLSLAFASGVLGAVAAATYWMRVLPRGHRDGSTAHGVGPGERYRGSHSS